MTSHQQHHHHPLSVPLFTLLYILSDLLLPFYNKILFSNLTSSRNNDASHQQQHDSFHYPVMITFIQLGSISLLLIVLYAVAYGVKLLCVDWIGTWLGLLGRQYGISFLERLGPTSKRFGYGGHSSDPSTEYSIQRNYHNQYGAIDGGVPTNAFREPDGNSGPLGQHHVGGAAMGAHSTNVMPGTGASVEGVNSMRRMDSSYDDLLDPYHLQPHHPHFLLDDNRISRAKLFFMKVKELLLVSFAFAAVITLSNLGLDKVALNVHVLLRTTTIFWIVTLSFCLKNERPSFVQIFFTLFVVSGACLLSMDAAMDNWKLKKSNVIGISINLISAFCSGVMGVSLRSACLKVQKPPYNMSIMEITTFKLAMASLFMLIPALVMDVAIARPTFFEAFFHLIKLMVPLLLGGIIVTALYQTAVVALTSRARALSVGVVHQLMLLPQLLMFTLLDLTHILPPEWKIHVFRYSVAELVGAGLIVFGVFGYALNRWHRNWKERRDIEIAKVMNGEPA